MKFIVVILLFLSLPSAAGEFKHSVGAGTQYALLGYQLGYTTEHAKLYAAVGPLTNSLGIQLYDNPNSNHALGIDATMVLLGGAVLSANYNYYFNGVSDNGLTLGIGVGKLGLFFADSDEEKADEGYVATVSLGYQF